MLIRREEALRKKDLSLYLSCISKAYRDREEDFSRLPKKKNHYSGKEVLSLKKEGKGWQVIQGL